MKDAKNGNDDKKTRKDAHWTVSMAAQKYREEIHTAHAP
jgi:hypothetical protein